MSYRLDSSWRGRYNVGMIWGNLKGWLISAAIVILTGVLLMRMHVQGQMTPATEWGQDIGNYDAIALPPLADRVAVPEREGNADPLYDRVIEDFTSSFAQRRQYEAAASGQVRDVPDLPAFDAIAEAGDLKDASLFADEPGTLVTLEKEVGPLLALQTTGFAAVRRADSIAEAQPEEARELYEGVFVLGRRLYEQRLSYPQIYAGYRLMGEAARGLATLALREDNQERLAELNAFRSQLSQTVNADVEATWKTLATANNPDRPGEPHDVHIGDVVRMARSAPEPLWRREAILKLGKYRFSADRAGDRLGVERVLRELQATETDPTVQLAIDQALALDEAAWRTGR